MVVWVANEKPTAKNGRLFQFTTGFLIRAEVITPANPKHISASEQLRTLFLIAVACFGW